MRINRHAATVIQHAEIAALLERNLNEGGMTRNRLVHRVVDHLGEEMMQGVGVGAADIHARPPPHGLETLEHLDGGGGVIGFAGRAPAGSGFGFHRDGLAALGGRGAEKIIHLEIARKRIGPPAG